MHLRDFPCSILPNVTQSSSDQVDRLEITVPVGQASNTNNYPTEHVDHKTANLI